jgi:3-hydroxybutyrate dehydrogenase
LSTMIATSPLKGRTSLVTDADKTIGRAIATALAKAGADVIAQGDTLATAQNIAAALPTSDGQHHAAIECNLADGNSIDRAMNGFVPRSGSVATVDILVHTSCPQHLSPVESFPDDAFANILSVGLVSYFRLVKALLPGMRQRGYGRLLAMSSVQGLVASVDKSAYVAAKHGLVGFTKAIALETAGSGVTANAFCPGWTGTEGTRAQAAEIGARRGIGTDEALATMLKEKQPSNQFVSVDALGQLVVFLCLPAADQITGIALPVDGGWTAQ